MLPHGSLGTATACNLEMQSTGSVAALVQGSQQGTAATSSNLAILSSGTGVVEVGGNGVVAAISLDIGNSEATIDGNAIVLEAAVPLVCSAFLVTSLPLLILLWRPLLLILLLLLFMPLLLFTFVVLFVLSVAPFVSARKLAFVSLILLPFNCCSSMASM